MQSRIPSILLALASLITLMPSAIAQSTPAREEMQPPLPLTIDFETQGCGRFRQEAYFRTEFHFVNICLGEASYVMVVTDNDGLGRVRVPVQKKGDRFEGISEQRTFYSIDPRVLIMTFPNQRPIKERVTYSKLGQPQPSGIRYNCFTEVASFPNRPNVSLEEADRLVRQRSGDVFVYRCNPINQPAPNASVTGNVVYRQRIALPPSATVEVKLLDVSRADAPAITIAEQTIITNGKQVPIPFTLPYNPAQINPRSTYAVQARILIDGQLRWISTSRYAVITQGNPTNLEVLVQPVR